ncbi:MAG: hypothetical protein JXQ87_04370 [Bacteroidia bacterium]
MDQTLHKLLFIALVILLAGCKKLPIYESSWGTEIANDQARGFNSSYQLNWQTANTQDYIAIAISTKHRPTITKILRTGFTVSFDPESGKEGKYSITYPVKPNESKEKPNNAEGIPRFGNGRGAGIPRQELMNRMLKRLPRQVEMSTIYGEQIVKSDSLPKGYNAHISFSDDGTLTYQLIIPRKDFALEDLNSLSIGLKSGAVDISNFSNRMGPQAGTKRSGADGDRRLPSADNSIMAQLAELEDPIKIWFIVNLAQD